VGKGLRYWTRPNIFIHRLLLEVLQEMTARGGFAPARVWIGPVARRATGGGRYIRSIVSHSSHHFRVAPEVPELLWGIRWVGRRFPLLRWAYPGYERTVGRVRVAHVHRSTLYAEAFESAGGRMPWIFTLHGITFEEYWTHNPEMARWARSSMEASLHAVKAATVATVVARWLRDYVEERTSVTPAVTPPGVDFREIGSVTAEEFLRWSGLAPGYVLWIGRLAHEKRLEWFIRLAERLRDLQFVAIANDERTRFLHLHGPRTPSNLHYFGLLPRGMVISALHGCSVHVNTSLYEASPTTLAEAMACGKPVVAPDHAGPKEVVDESQGGFTFHSRVFDDLVEQVLRALDHREVGRRGLAFVRDRRDWRKLVGFFDKLYAELARPSLARELN